MIHIEKYLFGLMQALLKTVFGLIEDSILSKTIFSVCNLDTPDYDKSSIKVVVQDNS